MPFGITCRSLLRQSELSVLNPSILPAVSSAVSDPSYAATEWRTYGGDPSGTQYPLLNQINRSNVHNLRLAWTYHSGDIRKRPPSCFEAS
jgi:glucose dehydrogenase